MYEVLRHLDLEPLMLFLVALGTVVAIRFIAAPRADDDPWDLPDDPGGDHAYPWWPEFERELRDYEAVGRQAAGSTVRVRA